MHPIVPRTSKKSTLDKYDALSHVGEHRGLVQSPSHHFDKGMSDLRALRQETPADGIQSRNSLAIGKSAMGTHADMRCSYPLFG
jgi:hypothetical protein